MLNPLRKSSLKSAVRPGLVLLTCCLSLLLVMMDTTIVNVAMPTIGRDLHASTTGLQWIIDAYTIVLATFRRKNHVSEGVVNAAPKAKPAGVAGGGD